MSLGEPERHRLHRRSSRLPSHLLHQLRKGCWGRAQQQLRLSSDSEKDSESKTETKLSYIPTMCKLQFSDCSWLGWSWLLQTSKKQLRKMGRLVFFKCVTDNTSSRSSKCVSCLRFVFWDLQNQNWTLLPQPGFCKIYRTEMSNITLIYFLVSKHFPLKMVFHTQNISSSCCFPRTPTMAQRPCLKRHFLPSLLQITHGPMEREGLHGSSKTAERKFLNLKKAFHLPKSTVRPM